jgi:F-type H+-transporting ATPase subunit delta
MTHSAQQEHSGNGAARSETVLDVGTERIARVYAEALLRAAEKQHQADEILQELEALTQQVLRKDPHFQLFLSSGAMGRERKAHVIRSAFENRASDLLVNFLQVLNDHERLDLLPAIAAAYRALRDQRAGRIRVQVQSAVPLPDDQREQLRRKLAEIFRKDPQLETQVNPDLLGGMVVRVDDWLYDQSVRAQLEDIRKQITSRSSYEIQSGRNRFSTPDGN